MEALLEEHAKLEKRGNLAKTIEDVQRTIELLQSARDGLVANPSPSPKALEKLQKPTKLLNDKVNSDLTEIYKAQNSYSKALDKKFTGKLYMDPDGDALASHPHLINQAISMHLLREGQFSVAATFMEEAEAHPRAPEPTPGTPDPYAAQGEDKRKVTENFNAKELEQQFSDMYHILRELRTRRNLTPAIAWARQNRETLETRGSNLEWELCRLQYVCLYKNEAWNLRELGQTGGPLGAFAYANQEFKHFHRRYARELQQLLGALAFNENLYDSPYMSLFFNETAWEEVATSFTREFCSLIGLSADSPLYIAVTAGTIALPRLLKLQNIMREKRTEWTTEEEMPIEIPLPPSYHFHSIFVCPVSKEQATDENPPKMMPCGHVILKTSMDAISKGQKFKCPYCPGESIPREALTCRF
ncbi:hypothetical protein EJ05DRAFT_500208 [Pseudovirgaria hyperparasitica]|uniref:GID complex catalytic subunit 2 n=1 Tax=Pseudovirgaria hyperparasitica TaxID=470096 RepID=A0A6A6W763_9PEZI|nr:uncharacterized protein EJ05DRAFT_500208 [Pseudovirgaria hyperparasitica]KAF2758692.1 hypothetical protein EJ05DRAFT_500208 [Pseudovirgaria hyperparasitica]